jgi:hypothetical protein
LAALVFTIRARRRSSTGVYDRISSSSSPRNGGNPLTTLNPPNRRSEQRDFAAAAQAAPDTWPA